MIITGISSRLIVSFIENSIAVKRAVCVEGKYAITIKAREIIVSKYGNLARITINRDTEGLEPFTLNIEKGKDFEDIILY